VLLSAILLACLIQPPGANAANGSVVYSYDALGRVITASYDTGVIVIYTYDANGNRTAQTINVNTQPLCLGTSAHSNPTTWGAGLWSTSASGC
jgi:YD repeat-containing protein